MEEDSLSPPSRRLGGAVPANDQSLPYTLIHVRGIENGIDYHSYIISLKDGTQPLPATRPVQDSFKKLCEKQGK